CPFRWIVSDGSEPPSRSSTAVELQDGLRFALSRHDVFPKIRQADLRSRKSPTSEGIGEPRWGFLLGRGRSNSPAAPSPDVEVWHGAQELSAPCPTLEPQFCLRQCESQMA